MTAKYPEHIKLDEVKEQSQVCGEFYEWLEKKHIIRPRNSKPIERLLAEFFEIDLDKLEREKRDMLEDLRRTSEAAGTQR